MDKSATIVVVEHDREVRALIELAIAAPSRAIVAKSELGSVLEHMAADGVPDLLIVDESVPGYENQGLRQRVFLAAKRIPVIVLRAEADRGDRIIPAERFLETLFKPFEIADLRARVEQALARGSALADATDAVSGLQTEARFEEELARARARAHAHKTPLTLVLAEVDDGSALVDRVGKEKIDVMIARIADAIERHLRSTDFAGKIGELKFAMLHPSCDAAGARIIVERMMAAIRDDPSLSGVVVSFGAAVDAQPAKSATGGLRHTADEALRAAKSDGQSRFRLRIV